MSTAIGLGDLAEDEIISKPLPMDILLENLKITLIEDRPPVNITSPGSIPINLQIGHMRVKRNEMGIFEIQPIEDCVQINENSEHPVDIEKCKRDRDRELISLQLIMQQLKIDNDSLKKQLNSMEQSNEANTYVAIGNIPRWFINNIFFLWTFRSKTRQESEMLKSYLKKAQDDIVVLLDEKRKLLDTVRNLQVIHLTIT